MNRASLSIVTLLIAASYFDFSERLSSSTIGRKLVGRGSYGELKEGDSIEIKFLAQ